MKILNKHYRLFSRRLWILCCILIIYKLLLFPIFYYSYLQKLLYLNNMMMKCIYVINNNKILWFSELDIICIFRIVFQRPMNVFITEVCS